MDLFPDTSFSKPPLPNMQHQNSILAAISFAAEQFLQSSDWEKSMNEVLAWLGKAVNVSRVYIFENYINENDLMAAKIRYEWAAPGISSRLEIHLLQGFSYEAIGFSRWLSDMGQGQPIIGCIADFPPAEQAVFKAQSTLSLVAVPIFVGAGWWGFVGFNDCLTERQWTNVEIDLLNVMANMLGAAIQRIQAKAALNRSESMNRTLLESLPDALFRVGANRRLLDAHGRDTVVSYLRHRQGLGLLLDEVVTLLPFYLQATAQQFVEIIEQALATGESFSYEYALTIDGRIRHYEARMMPHLEQEVLVLVRDVTERKQAEDMLREAQKMESVGVLAGGIAHDFNNLLTGLMAQASLAQTKLPADSPAQPHLVKILNISQRAADLTYQLLTYAGKAQARVETFDLNKLIRQNANLLETLLPRQSLCLTLADEPMIVQGDRGQLQQVVMNLIINAAEAIEGNSNGRVVIRTRLVTVDPTTGSARLSLRFYGGIMLPPGNYVCLQVTDNGIGIDKATLNHIFDPFFSTKTQGRGLGLSAILGIVSSHKGAVQVDSELGQGSCFSIWLPLRVMPQTAPEEEPLKSTTRITGMILLVDDEAPVREAVVDILQTLGLAVLTAANGQEGLALFEQHQGEITAVLLDMQMPVMDGKETLQAIRRLDGTVPVILSSGYSESELSDELKDGATTFLQKPYNMDRLIAVITAVVNPRK